MEYSAVDKTKVYLYPADYAREHGELPAYRESNRLNRDCAQAIDEAIRNRTDPNRLPLGIVAGLISQFGTERVHLVLANTVHQKEYDGRFSRDNKAWANTFPRLERGRDCVAEAHPVFVDGLIDKVRAEHRAMMLDVIGQYEKSHHMADRNRLTWFHSDTGEYRAKPGVTDDRIAARHAEIEAKRSPARDSREHQAGETVGRYTITRSILFENDRGFALGESPNKAAPQPFATWQFTNDNGKHDHYWGHYHTGHDAALKDYESRVNGYMADYPGLKVVVNPLAAAEMSAEQNFNMIDGRINNLPPAPDSRGRAGEPGEKPSLTEKLAEIKNAVKPPTADNSNKLRSTGMERE